MLVSEVTTPMAEFQSLFRKVRYPLWSVGPFGSWGFNPSLGRFGTENAVSNPHISLVSIPL